MTSRFTRLTMSIPEPPSYNDSLFSRAAQSALFQNMTLFFILANAAWIGIDTEWNNVALSRSGEDLPLTPASSVVDCVFCVFFTFELIVRLLAYRQKASFVRDNWFVFDGVLLIFMLVETGSSLAELGSGPASSTESLGVFRLLRLMRLTRLMRLMRFMPELMTLVRGMVRAMESVLFVVLFMLIILYSTSIVFTSQVGRPPSERPPGAAGGEDPTALDMFGDLGSSMMTLLTNGVLGDNLYETLQIIKDESLMLMWLFIGFVIISGITLLNMLIGVLCKVVQDTASADSEKRQANRLREIFVRAFQAVDVSGDGSIEEQEWSGIQTNPEVRKSILRLGVDEAEVDLRLSQLKAKVFWDRRVRQREAAEAEGAEHGSCSTNFVRSARKKLGQQLAGCGAIKLNFEEFVEQVSDLQWDKKATALDVAAFRSVFEHETKLTKKMLDGVEKMVMELFTPGPSRPAARVGASPPPELVQPSEVPPPSTQPLAPSPPEAMPPELHEVPELPPTPLGVSDLRALAAKVLPPLQAPPKLPPLRRTKVSPPRLPVAPHVAPLQLDLGKSPRSCGSGEARAPSRSSRQSSDGQREPGRQVLDRLATVPTDVLLDILKSRFRKPRRVSLSSLS